MADNVNVIRDGFFAPDFALSSTDGRVVSLKDFISDNFLALCFFSGRDSNRIKSILSELNKGLPRTLYDYDVRVVAISPDKINKLTNLKNELGLDFPLLSDTRLDVCNLYYIMDTKKKAPFVHFSIFVIDNEGIIRQRAIETPENEFRMDKFKEEISKLI